MPQTHVFCQNHINKTHIFLVNYGLRIRHIYTIYQKTEAKKMTELNVLKVHFIPPIVNIVEEYMYPNYRIIYDSVIRDINWVISDYVGDLHENILNNNDIDSEDIYTEEEWFSMFPHGYYNKYSKVLRELSEVHEFDEHYNEYCCGRFYTEMSYDNWFNNRHGC